MTERSSPLSDVLSRFGIEECKPDRVDGGLLLWRLLPGFKLDLYFPSLRIILVARPLGSGHCWRWGPVFRGIRGGTSTANWSWF
jgi:hypothetical protein